MDKNNEKSTGQKILQKIKEGHIKPKPKWEFLLKSYIIWLFFGLSIVVGSLSFSIMFFLFKNTNWQYYIDTEGILRKILIGLPYFWLLILILFIITAFYNFKHTTNGHKYSPLLIVLISMILSAAVGSIIYAGGGAGKLEDLFYRKMPLYQKIMGFQGRMLFAPKRGRMLGIVIEVSDKETIIKDFRGNIWSIPTSTCQLVVGQRVIVNGRSLINNDFEAQSINPWIRPERFIPPPCPQCARR